MNGAPHLRPAEMRRLLGRVGHQFDRAPQGAEIEQPRQLEQAGDSAGVVVRTRKITEHVVVRADDEQRTRLRAEPRDDVPGLDTPCLVPLLGDRGMRAGECGLDVIGREIDAGWGLQVSWAGERAEMLDVGTQQGGVRAGPLGERVAAEAWLAYQPAGTQNQERQTPRHAGPDP
jgi:hypothetical protein